MGPLGCLALCAGSGTPAHQHPLLWRQSASALACCCVPSQTYGTAMTTATTALPTFTAPPLPQVPAVRRARAAGGGCGAPLPTRGGLRHEHGSAGGGRGWWSGEGWEKARGQCTRNANEWKLRQRPPCLVKPWVLRVGWMSGIISAPNSSPGCFGGVKHGVLEE